MYLIVILLDKTTQSSNCEVKEADYYHFTVTQIYPDMPTCIYEQAEQAEHLSENQPEKCL